ncbi:unnamed protein product [Allacma fusca]|uniref:Uncharacterized protein n=1 Tax=Allacma fusca TaxID=39272 RepID=A0A8J2JSI0_9HEXA|nr:unnamed protein product [Allacma fusca]
MLLVEILSVVVVKFEFIEVKESMVGHKIRSSKGSKASNRKEFLEGIDNVKGIPLMSNIEVCRRCVFIENQISCDFTTLHGVEVLGLPSSVWVDRDLCTMKGGYYTYSGGRLHMMSDALAPGMFIL